jgi:hypothetical protein
MEPDSRVRLPTARDGDISPPQPSSSAGGIPDALEESRKKPGDAKAAQNKHAIYRCY